MNIMIELNPFEFVNSITYNKKNIINEADDPKFIENEYNCFLVNRSLSYHLDCILFANEMNRFPDLDKKLQYNYLLNSIRPKKRFSGKWVKKDSSSDLEFIMEYFNYNLEKAKSALAILSDNQLQELRKSQETGGYE